MTRLSLCAIAAALAAGHCLAEPSTADRAIHRFGDMEIMRGTGHEAAAPLDQPTTTTTTTTTTPAPTSTTTVLPDPSQWLDSIIRAVQQQLQLQDQYLRRFVKDLQDYLSGLAQSMNWDETQSAAFSRVGEMMELISARMNTARENVDELMATSDSLDSDTLRVATNKFMKEVRVQDVVVDALWASLRSMQTSSWVSGATVSEDRDAYAVANRAAEEFLTRMYHNLRAAGISEDDIVKFVPKTVVEETEVHGRNMGMKSRGYGWGYGGYYGYPSQGYGYGYGYPYYGGSGYGLSYPSYYGWYGWRRLRPTCPGCPPALATALPQQAVVPPFRTMAEETMGYPTPMMGSGFTPRMMGQSLSPLMMEAGMSPEYFAVYENMGYPMETMGTLGTMGETIGYNSFEFPGSYITSNRNLAPVNDTPGVFAESGMRNTQFGFGPVDEYVA